MDSVFHEPPSLNSGTTHQLNSPLCVCERLCYFSHCLRTGINTRVRQAQTDISEYRNLDCVLSMHQAGANIARPLITP